MMASLKGGRDPEASMLLVRDVGRCDGRLFGKENKGPSG